MTRFDRVPRSFNPETDAQAQARLPARVRARVWIEARHFFSRQDAQTSGWLWLLLDDGCVHAVRLPAEAYEDDARIGPVLAQLGKEPDRPFREEQGGAFTWPLAGAPVVPVPRWAVSWGHPLQRSIRAFAAQLDGEILAALGRLEVPGCFLGSVGNYNRLAMLPERVRRHRLQALAEFPPLVAPILLDVFTRPDLFGGDEDEPAHSACSGSAACLPVLEAMDRGRDLVGTLAVHYRVSRGLVRSPMMREPHARGCLRAPWLRLLDAMPAHARPCSAASFEGWLRSFEALPMPASAHSTPGIARLFARGWDATWQALQERFGSLPERLRDSRDFLRAAAERAEPMAGIAVPDEVTLGLAWLLRRGPASLLEASRRWHAQPAVARAPMCDFPASVTTILGELALAEGSGRELATREALADEGEAMHHCIGDYWSHCVLEGCRIVHLETPAGERATALYAHTGHPDLLFALQQLSGPCNAAPGAAATRLAAACLDVLNAPDLRGLRAEAMHEVERAHATVRPPTTPTTRPLDARSREELQQVLAAYRCSIDARRPAWVLYEGTVAGFAHHDGAAVLHQLCEGDRLHLAREPDNPHDPLAVRIDWNGRPLGYVPRQENARVAARMDEGAMLDAAIAAVRADDEWTAVECIVTLRPARPGGVETV